MKSTPLQALLAQSPAARAYFQALPTEVQLSLREQGDAIRSPQALFEAAERLQSTQGRAAFLSGEL